MSFSFARSEGFPTQYKEIRWPVIIDTLDLTFIVIFIILVLSSVFTFFRITKADKYSRSVRLIFCLIVGLIIILNNYGQEWEVAHIKTKTPYKVGFEQEITAHIGLKIGLRSINITLKSEDNNKPKELENETINYNERFEWTWDQGRFGFGPYAGRLQRQFRASQYRGLPLPILWVVDYLIVDGEGLRFGRFYRTAGWYTHIIQGATFPIWLVAHVLLQSSIRYQSVLVFIVGFLQLISNFVYFVLHNPYPLIIPFEDNFITTHFGINFWLNFVTGLICLFTGAVVFILFQLYPDRVSEVWGIDPLTEFEETQLKREDWKNTEKQMNPQHPSDEMEMEEAVDYADTANDEIITVLRRKPTMIYGQTKNQYRGVPRPPPPFEEEIYSNVDNMMDNLIDQQSNAPKRPPKNIRM